MLEEKIRKKRDELNQAIKNNEDYDKIYKISVELDELIAQYYSLREEKDLIQYNKKMT